MQDLFLSGSPVSDLTPLQGMPLSHLDLGNTPVLDLSPLEGMNLKMVWFTPKNITQGIGTLRQMKSLQVVGLVGAERTPPDEFWKKYDAGEFTRVSNFNDPGFQQWVTAVGVMPIDQQVAQVAAQLKVHNPWFDGKVTPTIENGVVTGLSFLADNVTDLSPVRALPGLTTLSCPGSLRYYARLTDLSPLSGMRLTTLDIRNSNVADLSPLHGMPLTSLVIGFTLISDLSPLEGMPLTTLNLVEANVTDLSPLVGMNLMTVFFTPGKLARGIDVLRQMKSLQSLGSDASRQYSSHEFWKKYDAGDFETRESPATRE